MTCPSCKKETSCGCKSCSDRPHEYKRNIMDKDIITCPYCGFKGHYDTWLNEDYKQYENKNK